MKLLYSIFIIFCFTLKVSADIPKKEYPRPQFERNDWINLNGKWSYELDLSGSGFEKGNTNAKKFEKQIMVPFAPETKLSGVEHKDFIPRIWYQKNIQIPASWKDKNIMLNFGAVYYESEVYIDGNFVGRYFGGSASFTYDISTFVKPGQTHNLIVVANSDVRSGKQTAGKQSLQLYSHNCNYTRTTGIWQTVWMEAVDPIGLKQVQINTDIDQGNVIIQPLFYHESRNTLRILIKEKGKIIAQTEIQANNSGKASIPIKRPVLWSPENPHLYDLTLQVIKNGKIVDEVQSYFGMRKVHIEGNKIYLNNKPYYQRLVLDQGFYPDGGWTSPSDEALKNDILLGIKAGFNGARLHQKVFEERYYYWADKLGYLTWGESASWGMDANDVEAARNFITEWSDCVIRDRNHPSLITWTPLNEEWWPDNKQYPRFAEDIYKITKYLDPGRPVNSSSGGTHLKTDIWTVHHYEQNPEKLRNIIYKDGQYFQTPMRTKIGSKNIGFNDTKDNVNFTFPKYDGKMPYLIDEFGGIKWVKNQELQQVDSKTESWGYGESPKSLEEFYTRLEQQVGKLLSISDQVWGYCYTQLTDVEQEQNGIYYYDRTSKFDMERIKNIFVKSPNQK